MKNIEIFGYDCIQDPETGYYFYWIVYSLNGIERELNIDLLSVLKLMDKFNLDVIEDDCLPEPLILEYEEKIDHLNAWEDEEWKNFMNLYLDFVEKSVNDFLKD